MKTTQKDSLVHQPWPLAPFVTNGEKLRLSRDRNTMTISSRAWDGPTIAPGPGEAILIVGARQGVGLELARQYAAPAQMLHATLRNQSDPGGLATIHAPMTLHTLDVRDERQVTSLARRLRDVPIALLLYVAGINQGSFATQLETNAIAPFRVIEALLPSVLKSYERSICLLTSYMSSGFQPAVAEPYACQL